MCMFYLIAVICFRDHISAIPRDNLSFRVQYVYYAYDFLVVFHLPVYLSLLSKCGNGEIVMISMTRATILWFCTLQ